jgi:hypothetical protein
MPRYQLRALVLAVVWQLDHLDRVAAQLHLPLRLEHQQQHVDALAPAETQLFSICSRGNLDL